mmetsp:Transcript_29115/g.53103  ORF Transcript_29115/g.53103 Transcript_29115/m.53103 type:complete len:615 (+) Transcript_29115:130-1974(+)
MAQQWSPNPVGGAPQWAPALQPGGCDPSACASFPAAFVPAGLGAPGVPAGLPSAAALCGIPPGAAAALGGLPSLPAALQSLVGLPSLATLQGAPLGLGLPAAGAAGSGEAVVECPQAAVGRVIGRGGETIRELQEKTGCSIQIKQDGVPDGQPRRITVKGPAAKLQAAVDMINATIGDGPVPVASAGGAAGTDIDPDVQEFCDRFQIDARMTRILNEELNKRPDTWETDLLALYEVIENARVPAGLLMVKIREMQDGTFVGKPKPDKDVDAFAKRYKLDSTATQRLAEVLAKRGKKEEDLEQVEKHLRVSNKPSALMMMLLGKLRRGEDLGEPEYKAAPGSAMWEKEVRKDMDSGKGRGKGDRDHDRRDRDRDRGDRDRNRDRGDRGHDRNDRDRRDRDRGDRDRGRDRDGDRRRSSRERDRDRSRSRKDRSRSKRRRRDASRSRSGRRNKDRRSHSEGGKEKPKETGKDDEKQSEQKPEGVAASTQSTAGEAAAETLPPGWTSTKDPTSGRTYYVNTATKEVQWELPQLGGEPLPEGWSSAKDSATGRSYYINKHTNEVQWERPNSLASVSQSSTSLPQGWSSAMDPGTGRTYYINSLNQQVQWDLPQQAASA